MCDSHLSCTLLYRGFNTQPAMVKPMKRLTLASPSSTVSNINDRLEALQASFEKNRHRYSFRRRVAIEDMLCFASSELHANALDEALNAWLPRVETFLQPMYPRAMAA